MTMIFFDICLNPLRGSQLAQTPHQISKIIEYSKKIVIEYIRKKGEIGKKLYWGRCNRSESMDYQNPLSFDKEC